MISTEPSLIDELARVEGKAEIVHGQIVYLPMTGDEPGYAGDEIFPALRQHPKVTKNGRAVGDGKGFLVDLPRRRSFSPDVALYLGWGSGMKFFPDAPILAVEVRRENDDGPAAEREMAAKRADYFAAGTRVVWDVDLLSEDVVRVFRDDEDQRPTVVYRRGDRAEAAGAVPGWIMPVDELFQA